MGRKTQQKGATSTTRCCFHHAAQPHLVIKRSFEVFHSACVVNEKDLQRIANSKGSRPSGLWSMHQGPQRCWHWQSKQYPPPPPQMHTVKSNPLANTSQHNRSRSRGRNITGRSWRNVPAPGWTNLFDEIGR